MKLYTSYWAMVRNFPNNLVGLNSTVWPPKWRPLGKDKRGVIVTDIPPLKPGAACEGLCSGKCFPKHPNNCEFLKAYYKQLQSLDFVTIMDKLCNLKEKICKEENFKDIDFAILVYETPQNICSERVIIQKWFSENGMPIEEWQK